jgi:Gpi18-like mannosyltransferase
MTGKWWVVSYLGCGLFLLGSWLAANVASRGDRSGKTHFRFALLLGAAVLLRMVLAAITKGYQPDITTFSAWAAHAADGLTSFYAPGYFADYPPGYIYVLWLIGKLRLVLALPFDSPQFMVLLKLPAILADGATTWLFYRLASRKEAGGAAAGTPGAARLCLAALYAFNPAVILDSSVWGQVDSVLTVFILLGVMLLEKNPAGAAASFTAALLIKPQALIFVPLPLLFFALRLVRRQQHAGADLLVFTGTAIVTFCLGIFPFALDQNPGWIIAKYGATLASYPSATLNAFNLFALTGANLAPVEQTLLALPYAVWGNIFIVATVGFAALVALRGRESARFWYLPLFLSASVFVLAAKMHERYLFPALALALGFYITSRDRRGLLLFAGFSLTLFLNVAQVLQLSYRGVYAVPPHDPLLLAVSLANVLLWLVLAWTGFTRYLAPQGPGSPQATME